MEFFSELNFLSVIEEERESAEGDSLEEAEKLKWKTDYQVSETTLSSKIGISDRKLKEKGVSKIPIRQDRLQIPGSMYKKETRNEKITSFQDNAGDGRYGNIPEAEASEPDSTFPYQNTKNDLEIKTPERSRVVETSANRNENAESGKQLEGFESIADNANIIKQNWFYIEPLNVETRYSPIVDLPDQPCSEVEFETPTTFSVMTETFSRIEDESNSEFSEEAIRFSGAPSDYCAPSTPKGPDERPFSILKGGSLLHYPVEESIRTVENYPFSQKRSEHKSSNVYAKNDSSLPSENIPTTSSEIINEINVNRKYQHANQENDYGKTVCLSGRSDDALSVPTAIELNKNNSYYTNKKLFEIDAKLQHNNENCLVPEKHSTVVNNKFNYDLENNSISPIGSSRDTTFVTEVENSFDAFEFYEPSLFTNTSNMKQDDETSDGENFFQLRNDRKICHISKTVELREKMGICQDATNGLITVTTVPFSNEQECFKDAITTTQNNVINAKHAVSQQYNCTVKNMNDSLPKSHMKALLLSDEVENYDDSLQNIVNSEFEESCDNYCVVPCSLDENYSLVCHERDENILEAPAEFRTGSESVDYFDEQLVLSQVSSPQPTEEEPPIRDHHNTCTTETDDTIQRPNPTGENERGDEKTQENRRTRDSDVSNPSSTNGVVPTSDNSTEDNDHVKQEGDNRNVSAFEHVGNNAPIQRRDMLQIDRSERGPTADPIGANSAVLDLRSYRSSCRTLRRSASFNDSFSDRSGTEIDKVQHERLAKLQERLGQALDLTLPSARFERFSAIKQDNPGENATPVDGYRCGDLNVSNIGFYRNRNNFLCDDKSDESDNVARRTFSESNVHEMSNCTRDLPSGDQQREGGKQDNNNNLSREISDSGKEVGYERGESPAVNHDLADSSSPSIPASPPLEERLARAPADAHLSESRFPKHSSSIHGESGVPAPAPGCSPTKTAAPKGCVGSRRNSPSGCSSCSVADEDRVEEDVHGDFSSFSEISKLENLRWSFKNGRLVFDSDNKSYGNDKNALSRDLNANEVNLDSIESTDSIVKLSSKQVNRRINENKSRLRYLEEKLKRAGLSGDSQTSSDAQEDISEFKSDVAKQVVDESESTLWEELKENKNCGSTSNTHEDDTDEPQEDFNYQEAYADDLRNFTGGEEFCQFDVSQVGSFSPVLNGYCLVYDELNEETDSEEEFHVISLQEDPNSEEEFYVISNNSKKPSDKMGTDSDRPKHNPDTENLRSLLKRPGKNKDRKSNRVVFNENRNEFFDADYIILIREECDYDDEDDESVCTCNQHEMVRLTCCEPNCNCSVYDGFDPTPQSPKFAPPLEFVDAVTLSPPEGYKDMELGEQQLLALQQLARRGQQRRAVCRECSATHTEDDADDGEGSQSDEGGGHHSDSEEPGGREKTDQSQQTTPTTPDNCTDDSTLHDFTVDRSPMTVSENVHSSEDECEEKWTEPSTRSNVPAGGSPISGILKGGKLWKQPSLDGGPGAMVPNKSQELQQNTDSSVTSDEEGCPKRFVRFIESEVKDQRGGCDGASDDHTEEDSSKDQSAENQQKKKDIRTSSAPPESTEMMLTFKLGNHVLISNNSLKPNSAVRQLFPCTKPTIGKDEESVQQYLVTAESLRAFEEAKRSKLPQIIQNGETDESIRKAIERNTLRRSLIRYEPRSKKNQPKTDNSLVERIKQLTCDVDNDLVKQDEEEIQVRASPPGEEARNSPEITAIKQQDKSFSPSSSSTASSNSSSASSTYKKITDLFNKKTDKLLDVQNNLVNNTVHETKTTPTLPDLGNGPHEIEHAHLPVSRINSCTNESRKQFLASLAPLTACVSGIGSTDDYFYQMNNHHDHGGQRTSVASSVGTEYSLEDIDEALRNDQEDTKRITPDVLAGTPSASESGDELAMFVQQDAGRIERIKKKYQPESNKEEDDEHDDYGFNKRPSVRGIKPRFGTTTQIIQQIQNQMQPPDPAGRVSWPYYSESGLSVVDNSKTRNSNQNVTYQYPPAAPEEFKSRGYPNPYRPTSLTEENMYQSGQFCKQVYKMNGNSNNYPTVMKLGARCNDMYQSLPRQKTTVRPLSPPPLEMSKAYHQTMVYIPYNHIEGCQDTVSPNMYYQQSDYARVSNQNQINKRFIEPIYQQRFHMHSEDHHYSTNIATSNIQKQFVRIPYPPQPHGMNCRSESPLSGQFSTARSTQTPVPNCNYYTNQRYRPIVGSVWQGDPGYISKINRHSFPMSQRYTTSDTSTDTDSSQGVPPIQNGYRQSIDISLASQKDTLGNSPIKPKFTERGVPEGAASVSPPDTLKIGQSSSTITSPTSPQNVSMQTQKPLFYAMNV